MVNIVLENYNVHFVSKHFTIQEFHLDLNLICSNLKLRNPPFVYLPTKQVDVNTYFPVKLFSGQPSFSSSLILYPKVPLMYTIIVIGLIF